MANTKLQLAVIGTWMPTDLGTRLRNAPSYRLHGMAAPEAARKTWLTAERWEANLMPCHTKHDSCQFTCEVPSGLIKPKLTGIGSGAEEGAVGMRLGTRYGLVVGIYGFLANMLQWKEWLLISPATKEQHAPNSQRCSRIDICPNMCPLSRAVNSGDTIHWSVYVINRKSSGIPMQ